MAKCLVCGGSPVKYRFTCCRERYCSLACYKVHSNAPCWAREAEQAPAKKARQEPEEEEDLLSEVRLCALRGHQGVRSALRSERFCDVLKHLDSADDRRKALEELLEKDSYFVGFVENMMEAIDYRNG
mmetsp:Transcript_51739/g.116437  ORF Transcript_51739/g.116437 Transcript_51739/m.116437 type:complete len:128 (+) Transcript_51739:103-486(+)